MPTQNHLMASAILTVEASATNGSATASISAPDSTRNTIVVYGLLISMSAAPATAVAALFKDGSTTKLTINIPAAAQSPIYVPFPAGHPYVVTQGAAASLVCPALGSGVVGTAAILYNIDTY